jgi:hypothetical protein
MAERPKNSDKFSDYINLYYQQLTGITGAPSAKPIAFPDLPAPKQKLGFLGRTVDILSRPMRIVSNPAMKLIELPERMDKVKELRLSGQDAEATKESLNAVGSLLASPFTGFFSDDPSNKPYWSDIIEKQEDVVNRNDPNYKDVANNVDPKIKGALGFVGDVLIDPLWLIPGGWAAKAAKEGSRAAELTRGITTGEKVGVPNAVDVLPVGQFRPDMKAFGSGQSYDLITTVNGKSVPRGTFPTEAAAREAAKNLGARKGSRPWVEASATAKPFRGTNTYRIVPKASVAADVFPAAQAAQKVSDDLVESAVKGGATASETVLKSLREVVNAKTATVGGKTVGLRKELESFFEGLSKAAPAPKVKAGKPIAFAKWSETAFADKVVAASKLEVPPNSVLAQPLGKSSTVANAIRVYRDTKNPEIKQAIERLLLKPAYEKYAAGVKSGKPVDLLGNATTPTARVQEAVEANVASIIVRNLKNLDDAERARGAALLGDDLFAELQTFSPKGMTKFLDDIDAILKETGAIDALAGVGAQTLTGRVLRLFESDPALRAAAEAQLARSIDDIPNVTPENVAARVATSSRASEATDFVTDAFTSRGISENLVDRVNAVKEAVAEVLPNWIRNQLDEVYQKGVYPYQRKGALKTDPEFGKGRAVNPRDLNADSQSALMRDLMIALNKFYQTDSGASVFLGTRRAGEPKKFEGDKFIREKEKDALIAFELADELLKRQGLAPVFRLDGITQQISFSQAWRTVSEVMDSIETIGSRWLAGSLFNAFSPVGKKGSALLDGTLPPQVFAYAVARGIQTGDKAQVLAILTSKESPAGVAWVNGLADAAAGGKQIKLGRGTVAASTMLDNIAEGIVAAREALNGVLAANTKVYAERALVEGKQITAEAAEIIADIFNSAEKTAAQIRVAASPSSVVEDIAKVVPTTELGQGIAQGILNTSIGPEVMKAAQLTESIADGVAAGNKAKIKRSQNALMQSAEESAKRVLDDAARLLDDMRNVDEYADVVDELSLSAARRMDAAATEGRSSVVAGMLKILDPLKRIFDSKYGMNTREMLWGSRLFFAQGNAMAMVNKPFIKSLQALSQNDAYAELALAGGKRTVLQQAFENLQRGVKSAEGSVLRKAEDDLRPLMARFFDQTNDVQNALLGNAFFRTGAGREAINDVLGYAAILGRSNGLAKTPPRGIFFDEALAVKTATENAARAGRVPTQAEITAELLNQWKTWPVDDVLDFMYRTNRAMVQLAAEVAFVTQFQRKAFELGLASRVPKKGFVKIVAGEDSRYGKFLDEAPLYMDKDAAEMFQAIDNFAKTSKQFDGGFGKFVRTTLDPITNTWKYAVTLPRPGHHIRNMIGDITLTYLAEGIFGAAVATKKAFQLMAMRGSYSDIDLVKAMTYQGITEIPKNTTVMSKGRFGSLTADELMRDLFFGKGILIPARQREGLMARQGVSKQDVDMPLLDDDDVITNAASRLLEKGFAVASLGTAARGGRMENAITEFSEGRDTFVRMQHALQILEKAQQGKVITRGFGTVVDPKKLSKEELFDIIAERVSKYHPDMATLSVSEKKYLRRLMPFYHWNRGAIQAVLETLVMNPGRVVAFNKASYNVAIAAGINPDSMFNPFPGDQMFPSFLQEQMQGPQFELDGRYFGVRPGVVTFDVLNQFATGNPVDTILDNANPAFKIPIELLTGTRLGTQSRIRDYSDFIDSSIPGVNYVANVSGKSVTGSFYSLLTGGGFDPQYQFEVGNKDANDQLISAVNWLTGIGLTDYSRPSYIRIAQQEEQQRRRREAEGPNF